MIDGYISRPRFYLTQPIVPNRGHIIRLLCAMQVQIKEGCSNKPSNHRKLDAVIAMHGHFDHALDSPLIACLTAAQLVGGPVVAQIKKNTETLYPECKDQIAFTPITGNDVPYSLNYNPVSVTLIGMGHSKNLASEILENSMYDKQWTFPATIYQMKLGVSVGAHLKLGKRSVLIVPTAGKITDEFEDDRYRADTVFLGVGALGSMDIEYARNYWENTVGATEAKWVVPVHWDSMTGPLKPEAPELKIPFYEKLNRVFGWFQTFAKKPPGATLLPVPLVEPFDPFFGTTPKDSQE